MKLTYSKMVAHYLDNVVLKTECKRRTADLTTAHLFGER